MGTKINSFVYNTLAQWYNEDARAAGSNNTLPAAPSGPQAPPSDTGPRTFLGVRLEWNNPVFIAVSGCATLPGVFYSLKFVSILMLNS